MAVDHNASDQQNAVMVADETQSLLRSTSHHDDDRNGVEVENANLPENWSLAYRWGIVALLAFMAFTVTFTCISVVPVAGHIVADLNGGEEKRSGSVLLVTIWELGEAAGPLFVAPASEYFGRYPIFNAANILFIAGAVITALSQNVSLLIFSRFMTGCAVASNVLNPAIIGDLFPSEQRGSAMSTIMLAPLIGGAIGPAIAGAIAQSVGWRQIIWMAIALSVIAEVLFLTLFRETYKVVILKKHAVKQETDSDDDSISSKKSVIWTSLTRPVSVFGSSVILQILSLYGSLAFTFFYVMSTTLPDILKNRYNFPPSLVGTSFMSFSVGSVIGIIVCNTLLDRIYKKMHKPGEATSAPENRLPLVIIGAFALPCSVAFYGWVAQLQLPAPLLLFAVGFLGFCLILSIVPMMAYIVDAFSLYSASAMTAVLITRCLMGTFLPLVTAPLTDAIGYGFGFTVLAGACLLLAPIPLSVMRYGGQWRQRSKYTRDE